MQVRAACIALLILGLFSAVGRSESVSIKRVQFLDSFGRQAALSSPIIASVREELTRQSSPIDFYIDSVEVRATGDTTADEALINFLERRAATAPVDLFITIGAPALRFAVKNREQVLRGAPLLAIGFDVRMVPKEMLSGQTATVALSIEPTIFIKGILELLPETRDVYLIVGTSPIEKSWKAAFRLANQQFADRLRIHWWDNLSLAEMQKQVALLPPDSVVLYTRVVRDAAGIAADHDESLAKIRRSTSVPLFGFLESDLGAGIIGGRLVAAQSLGRRAAEIAVRIMDGADPKSVSSEPMAALPPMYDYRELRRWDISEDRLPAGSTVLFRPLPFWIAYRWHLLVALGLFIVQALLLIRVYVHRRRRGRAEQHLAETEKRLLLIANHLPVLIAYVDDEQRYQFCNQAFQSWFNIEPESVCGRTMHDVLGDGLYQAVRPFVERVLAGESAGFTVEAKLDDGRDVAVDGMHVPDLDARGAVRGFYAITTDVTAHHQARQESGRLRDELVHAERVSLMGVLSATLAHELSQPLTAIMSNAQAARRFLNSPSPDLQEVSTILEDIAQDDQRASEVIRQVRALVKKEPTDFRPLSIAELLSGVERLVHKNADLRHIDLVFDVDADLPEVRGNHPQLQQVLLNLLLNAFDATEESGRKQLQVTVRARREQAQAIIEVRDQGPGIPGPMLERLFEPFQTSKTGGLGIGLSISKSIVDLHGGRLWAENNADRGATFFLSLPVVLGNEQANTEDCKDAEHCADGLCGR
jgi:PAS domain S-box-containing protein